MFRFDQTSRVFSNIHSLRMTNDAVFWSNELGWLCATFKRYLRERRLYLVLPVYKMALFGNIGLGKFNEYSFICMVNRRLHHFE